MTHQLHLPPTQRINSKKMIDNGVEWEFPYNQFTNDVLTYLNVYDTL